MLRATLESGSVASGCATPSARTVNAPSTERTIALLRLRQGRRRASARPMRARSPSRASRATTEPASRSRRGRGAPDTSGRRSRPRRRVGLPTCSVRSICTWRITSAEDAAGKPGSRRPRQAHGGTPDRAAAKVLRDHGALRSRDGLSRSPSSSATRPHARAGRRAAISRSPVSRLEARRSSSGAQRRRRRRRTCAPEGRMICPSVNDAFEALRPRPRAVAERRRAGPEPDAGGAAAGPDPVGLGPVAPAPRPDGRETRLLRDRLRRRAPAISRRGTTQTPAAARRGRRRRPPLVEAEHHAELRGRDADLA